MAFQSVITGKDGTGQPTYNSQYGFHVNPTIVTAPVSLYALRDDQLHMGYNIRPVEGVGTTPSDGLWRVASPPNDNFLTPIDSTKGIVFQTVENVTFVRSWGVQAPNAAITRGTFNFFTGGDYLDSIKDIYADLKRTIPAPFYSPDFERMNGKSGTSALAEGFRVAGNVLVEGFTLGAFQGASESNHITPGGFFYDKYSTSKPLAATCLVDMIKYVDDRIEVVKKEAFVSGLIQAAAMAAAGKLLGTVWDRIAGHRNRVRPLPVGPGAGPGGRTPPRLPTDVGPAVAAGTAAGLGGGLLSDLLDGGGGARGRPGRDGEDGRDGYWMYQGSTRTLEPVYDYINLMLMGGFSIFPPANPDVPGEGATLFIGDLNKHMEISVGPSHSDIHITAFGALEPVSYKFFHGQHETHRLSTNAAGWTTSEYWSTLNGDCILRLQVPGNVAFPVVRRCDLLVSGETGSTELRNYSLAPTLFKNNPNQPWRFVDIFEDPFAEDVGDVTMVQINNGTLTARNPGSTQLVVETTSLDQSPGMTFRRQGQLRGRIESDNEGSMRFASNRDYAFYSAVQDLANDQRPRLYMHVYGDRTKLDSTPRDYYPFWSQDGIVHVESYRETPDDLANFARGAAGLVCRAWAEGRATPTDGALVVHPEGQMQFVTRPNTAVVPAMAYSFRAVRSVGLEDTFMLHEDATELDTLVDISYNGKVFAHNTVVSEYYKSWSPNDGAWLPNARHFTAGYFANTAFQPIVTDNQYERPTSSVSVDFCIGESMFDTEFPVSHAYASIWLHREKYGASEDINGNPTSNYTGVPALNISVKESGEAIRTVPTLTIYEGVVEVKGDLIVTGQIAGLSSVDGSTILNQNVTIDGTLTVNDEVVINNGLTVTGNTTLRDDTTINGNLTVGSVDVTSNLTAANIECAQIDCHGPIRCQGVYQTSDSRRKNIIHAVSGVLDKVMHMNVYDFTLKDDDTHELITGLMAQDVETMFPQLVRDDACGYKSLNYMGLIPILLQAIKELGAEVKAMKNASLTL